jgi:hypothetical protein
MVPLIFLVALIACHNLSLLPEICNSELDLSAGPYVRKQDHPIPELLTTASLNTVTRLINPSWVNPAGASISTSKSATRLLPKITPSAPPSSLGKRTTSLTANQRVILLQMGGAFWYSGKMSIKEINYLPKEPHPPLAPNIDLPAEAFPDILPLIAKRQSPQPLTMLLHLTAAGPQFTPFFLASSTDSALHHQFPQYSASNLAFTLTTLIPDNPTQQQGKMTRLQSKRMEAIRGIEELRLL